VKNLTPICFGCEPLGGTDWGDVNMTDMKKAIHTALDLGVNFFDTAGVYGLGMSEERLSNILGDHRHDVFIATKGGLSWNSENFGRASIRKDSSSSAIRKDVESSLRRLRLECLPIFYIHWPDENVPFSETFGELEKICDEGKIESIGCSNFSVSQIKEASKISKIKYTQLPVNVLSGPLNKDIEDICTKKEIAIVAYNVLANGLLSGKYDKDSIFPKNDRRSHMPLFRGAQYNEALELIKELKVRASRDDMSILQYSINWTLSQPNIQSAIVGIKNSQQIKDNWSAVI
jgi:myo-inositol catabolism protein IolS